MNQIEHINNPKYPFTEEKSIRLPTSFLAHIRRSIIFVCCALFIYAYSLYCLTHEETPLKEKILFLESKKYQLQQQVLLLKDKIQGLCDPAADEYAIITRLGMAPQEYKKIILSPSLLPSDTIKRSSNDIQAKKK